MNATDLLTELRPPLEDAPAGDDATLERILLAGPEKTPRPRRYARPLAVAGATAVAATAAVALVPSGGGEPVGLAGAVAALTEPDVLLHFKVTTTHAPSGSVETAETWQTPDGRRSHTIYGNGIETAYDQRAAIFETYAPELDEVIVQTDSEFFEDGPNPFGSIATTVTSGPTAAGDLPALVTRALSGKDPKVRYVGRTMVRGIEVDQIRIKQDLELADVRPGTSLESLKDAPTRTVTIVRDVYVRHDNALPVRVVARLGALGADPGATTTSEFTDVQKLTLDAATEPTLELTDHPGAKRTVRGPFDDSKSDSGA